MQTLTAALQGLSSTTSGTYSGRVVSFTDGRNYASVNGRLVRIDSGTADVGDRVAVAQTPQGMILLSATPGSYSIAGPKEILIDL